MKTLAELRRHAKNFQWSMIKNSWAETILPELKCFRDVAEVTTKYIAFYTPKNGVHEISYINLPKAKDLRIEECTHENEKGLCVTFTDDCVITYFLRHK